MDEKHRILLSGVGSIGERHLRNLLALGYEELAVHRVRNQPFRTLERDFQVFSDLDLALRSFEPTVVFVTNPTAGHLPVALAAARAGCHLLIEKPLSHNLDGVDALLEALHRAGRFAMVGYMLRFHPLLRQVKAWLDEGPEGTLGRPVFARVSWGEHVPDWHPWEDYRESYSVRSELGGGPALTLSHEIDLLIWLFGPAEHVVGLANHASPLETSCEHALDALVRFPGGVTANLHLDYFQSPPQRSWELVGSRGRVVFDYYGGTLTLHRAAIGARPAPGEAKTVESEPIRVPPDFDRNEMFLAELRYFFDAIDAGTAPEPGVAEAAETVRIALKALETSPP